MSKIVINKNLAKYFYKFVDNVFKPLTANTTVTGYSAPTTATTGLISALREVVITKQSTLTTLDKISAYYRNVTNTTDWTNDLSIILTSIVTQSTRATTLASLVTKGVITQAESDAMLLINLTDRPIITSTLTDDVVTFNMTNPNKLVRRYVKSTDNSAETMYLLFPYYTDNKFNGVIHYGSVYYSHPTTSSELSKQVLSYIAISLGTTGTEDIVLDYDANIDYIDDMSFKIKLPTTIIV